MSTCHRLRGFSLVELLITVAIVAILAAIAYPSYVEQLKKGRRAEMQAQLMGYAQFMERIYSETGCYNPGADYDCTAGTAATLLNVGSTEYYDVAVTDESASSFKIKATPKTDSPQSGDGALTIDHTGARTWDGNDHW